MNWEFISEDFLKLEAPAFGPDGQLYFSDMGRGVVYRLGKNAKAEVAVPDRPRVGGIAAHAQGGLVVSGLRVSVIQSDGTERVVLPYQGGGQFNDLTTDADGRVYVGMFGTMPGTPDFYTNMDGALWRIDPDGKAERYHELGLANGMQVWTKENGERLLYHVDTRKCSVLVSTLDGDGAPSAPRVLHRFESDHQPDGMAMDVEGGIWVAIIGQGKLLRLTQDGNIERSIDVPRKFVTSLCFGGADMRDVYVTTFGPPNDPEHTGALLHARFDIPGLALDPARI